MEVITDKITDKQTEFQIVDSDRVKTITLDPTLVSKCNRKQL